MKLIPLSTTGKKNKGKYFAQVDDEDYGFLMQWKWSYDGGYAVRTSSVRDGRKTISMHRQVMNVLDLEIQIDHRDRVRINNQKSNLRKSTQAQNMQNKTPHGVSRFSGVSFESDRNKWRGNIKANGVRIRKRFDTEIEAANWRNEKAKELFGDFAFINQL